MTTEERVTLLEGSLSTLNRVLSAQELHNRDVAHNMRILQGIVSEQQLDIKAVLASQKDGDKRLARVEDQLDRLSQQVDASQKDGDERLARVEDQLDRLSQQVDVQFTAVNQRLDALIVLITSSQGKQP